MHRQGHKIGLDIEIFNNVTYVFDRDTFFEGFLSSIVHIIYLDWQY